MVTPRQLDWPGDKLRMDPITKQCHVNTKLRQLHKMCLFVLAWVQVLEWKWQECNQTGEGARGWQFTSHRKTHTLTAGNVEVRFMGTGIIRSWLTMERAGELADASGTRLSWQKAKVEQQVPRLKAQISQRPCQVVEEELNQDVPRSQDLVCCAMHMTLHVCIFISPLFKMGMEKVFQAMRCVLYVTPSSTIEHGSRQSLEQCGQC